MRKWTAIVFDLDDTLYPESAFVLSGFRSVAAWMEERFGIDREKGVIQLRSLFEQGVRGNTFNLWLAQLGLENQAEDLVPKLVEIYRNHNPKIYPFPETRPILEKMRHSFLLGLVSDGHLGVQQRKWEALGLSHFFHAVVFSDAWGREAWKPNTKPFREVLKMLEVAPHDAVYVGDNPLKDFLGARAIGMATIWVRRPGGLYTHLQPPSTAHGADYIVDSLESLAALVEQNAG
nr:MAG: HAD superfamily hydrolase [Bacteroidota bacterium]